jgi:hypothetical protein
MWLAFAHLAIFGLVIFGFMLLKDAHPQKDAMLVSIGVGVVVLVIYAGPFGLLTAASSGLIGYGFSRSL